MGEIEKLEEQVEGLQPDELAKFRSWFLEFDARVWDRRLEDDVRSGKLQELMAEARRDFESGQSREL